MSDERLRDLERHWKETGAVEDESAYLLERVRTGGLRLARLELAAYCGHPGASLALGRQGKQAPAPLDEFLLGLMQMERVVP